VCVSSISDTVNPPDQFVLNLWCEKKIRDVRFGKVMDITATYIHTEIVAYSMMGGTHALSVQTIFAKLRGTHHLP
jgi:hypothetical protein